MIINSVIAGGGGDEVEAKALGEAVNAVAGDKVTLNFSADIPIGLEGFLLPANSYNGVYQGPSSAAYVDSDYIYYSAPSRYQDQYAYNKKTGERTTLDGAYLYYVSQFGLNQRSDTTNYLQQFIAGKIYRINVSCYSYYANTSDGKIAIICAGQRYGNSTGYRILMRDTEGFYSQIVYIDPNTIGVPLCLLDSEDKVNYPLICRKKDYSGIVTYNINTFTKTLDLVGSITKTAFGSDAHECVSASLGDITFRFGNRSSFEDFYVFRTIKDENGVYDVEFLGDLRQQVINYLTKSGLGDSYACCGFVGNILCLQNDRGSTNARSDAFIKVDPDALTITGYDFAPGADMSLTGLYGNGYSIAYYGIEGSIQKYTVGFMQPIEQPYVATSPQTARFFANQTLTGIVKENNNGVLKVSTVEDPNNPPPAVPDVAGFKTVINYGSPTPKANATVVGSPTISGADVSGFTSSSYVHIGKDYKSVSNAKYVFEFTTGSSISSTQNVVHCDYLLPVYFQNSTLRSYSWGNYGDMSILDTPAANTRYRVEVVINAGVRHFTVTNLATSSVQTTEQTDSRMDVSANYNITFGVSSSDSSAPFEGVLHLDSSFIEIDGERVWTGAGINFGSVSIGYGYFLNNARSYGKVKDKYVTYEGGTIGKDDVWNSGTGSLTLHPMVYRTTDMGSWVSDTEACLYDGSTWWQGGAYTVLDTPVYLWHDGSYITPAVPETLEPEVTLATDVTLDKSDFSATEYITIPAITETPTTFEAVISFTTASTFPSKDSVCLGFNSTDYSGVLVAYRGTAQTPVGGVMFYVGNGSDWFVNEKGGYIVEASTKYYLKLVYDNGSWTLSIKKDGDTDYTVVYNISDAGWGVWGSDPMWFGNGNSWSGNNFFNGTMHLHECYMNVNGATYWEGVVRGSGTVSLPVSWKTLDGVVYEYPDGFPATQASDLETNIVVGNNNLYVTKTGANCGLAISSTSPAGVDSSAVIGTVELDANGAITSYTPRE